MIICFYGGTWMLLYWLSKLCTEVVIVLHYSVCFMDAAKLEKTRFCTSKLKTYPAATTTGQQMFVYYVLTYGLSAHGAIFATRPHCPVSSSRLMFYVQIIKLNWPNCNLFVAFVYRSATKRRRNLGLPLGIRTPQAILADRIFVEYLSTL
jgi:hypothetical protein